MSEEHLEQEQEDYDDEEYQEKVRITHKLASTYGWTYHYIWQYLPYKMMKALSAHIDELRKDQDRFLCPEEIAGYKNLLRRFGKK